MSQAPSMPMYWDAYIADTTHLTTEEHGAYLLLLGAMWRRNGWVPDDDKDNARILGLTPARWKRIKGRLEAFLTIENGEITQKKLLETWKNTQEKIQKNRENGSKGGRPRSKKNKDLEKAKGSVSDNPNETIPEPEPLPLPLPDTLEPSGSNANAREDLALPDNVDSEFDLVWEHYPRKVAKAASRKEWRKARKRHSFDEITQPLGMFIRCTNGTPMDKIPHLRTWLHQERWNDDQTHARNAAATSDQQLDGLMASAATSDSELDSLFPDHPQKLISQHERIEP